MQVLALFVGLPQGPGPWACSSVVLKLDGACGAELPEVDPHGPAGQAAASALAECARMALQQQQGPSGDLEVSVRALRTTGGDRGSTVLIASVATRSHPGAGSHLVPTPVCVHLSTCVCVSVLLRHVLTASLRNPLQVDAGLLEQQLQGGGSKHVPEVQRVQLASLAPCTPRGGTASTSRDAGDPSPPLMLLLLEIGHGRPVATIQIELPMGLADKASDLAAHVWSSSRGCELPVLSLEVECRGDGQPLLRIQVKTGSLVECLDIFVTRRRCPEDMGGPRVPWLVCGAVFLPAAVAKELGGKPQGLISDLGYVVERACLAEPTPLALGALEALLRYLGPAGCRRTVAWLRRRVAPCLKADGCPLAALPLSSWSGQDLLSLTPSLAELGGSVRSVYERPVSLFGAIGKHFASTCEAPVCAQLVPKALGGRPCLLT